VTCALEAATTTASRRLKRFAPRSDVAPIRAGEKDFASTAPSLSFRLNDSEAHEMFTASAAAFDALADYTDDGKPPPWDFAAELLADGLIDVQFALTPRGRRALTSR
jgi:hypothetical protein